MTQSQRWSDVRAHVCLIKSDTSFHPSLPSSFWLRWRTRCPPLFHLTGSKSAGRLSHFGTHRSQTGRFSNVSNSPSPPASSFQQLNNDADFYFNAALKTSQLPWCQNGSEIHSDSCFLCLSLLFCAALHYVGNNKLGRKIVNFFLICVSQPHCGACVYCFSILENHSKVHLNSQVQQNSWSFNRCSILHNLSVVWTACNLPQQSAFID